MANGNDTYALVAQFRQRLVAREKQATTRLAASYRRIYTDLSGRAMDLREVIEAKRAKGEPVSANAIRRLEQYQRLMETTQHEMTRYRAVVEDEVLVGQRDAALMGVREGPEMLERALAGIPEEPRARIMATFGVLPTEAVESLVGALQEKSPLIESLSRLGEGVAQQFGERLVLGLASGVGSRKIAADIRKELGVPLTDALRITRTALNKSHQMASLAGYRANPHIIKGWRWSADLGPRTCMACIALHGQLFPLEEEFSDHWCGRCAPTPETVSMAELGLDIPETRPKIESGEDWFRQQPEAVQRAMMGDGKYNGWVAGQFEFGQLVRESQDPVWGRMYGEQSLKGIMPKTPKELAPEPKLPPKPWHKPLRAISQESAAEISIDQLMAERTMALEVYPEQLPRLMGTEEAFRGSIRDPSARQGIHESLMRSLNGTPYARRGELKEGIATRLAELSGVDYDSANQLVASWADTSGDDGTLSVLVQNVAAKQFDLNPGFYDDAKLKALMDIHPPDFQTETREAADKYVPAVYRQTQEWLKENGIENVKLFRGMTLPKETLEGMGAGDLLEMTSNPLASWSVSKDTADIFARTHGFEDWSGCVVAVEVPAERIFSTAVTGAGCLGEQEFIVLGGRVDVMRIVSLVR